MIVPDRLQHAKSRPAIVEEAVRTALRDSIAWRIGGGAAPTAAAFVTAAVAAARLRLDAGDGDAAQRSMTLSVVQRVATRFTGTPLCRRLMRVPASKFIRLPHTVRGADILVRGPNRRLHAIALTARADGLEAGQIATRVAMATPLPIAERLTPLTVHIFSLATGHHHPFERDVFDGRPDKLAAAQVA